MIRATSPLRIRPGFTLVELMVGAAIVVLIMAVLATCFQLATDAMREMKATGDLASQLRGAETVIRRDLEVDHFLPEPGRPTGRLSDQNLDQVFVNGTTLGGWRPPKAGFFRMKSAPIDNVFNFDEGIDPDGIRSTRATNHFLHFTSIQPDAVDSQPYAATSGGNEYKSRAAEIAYFLDPAPSGTTGGSTPLPLYRLIRRQRLVALNAGYTGNYPTNDDAVVSTRLVGMNRYVNTMGDVTYPEYRLGRSRTAVPTAGAGDDGAFAPLSTSTRLGEDILLANVISFEVRPTWAPAAGAPPAKLPYVRAPFSFIGSTDHPFDSLPAVPATASPSMAVGQDPAHTQGNTLLGGQNIFDTWSSSNGMKWDTINAAGELTPSGDIPPLFIRVQALQIRIRVWDSSTQTTRQITIVQDM